MDPRNVVKLAYDSIGSEFGKKRTNTWDFVIDWLKELKLKRPANSLKLLIAGCGNGRHVRLADDLGFDVFAIDISPKMVSATIQSEIENGRDGSNISISDICDLPFLDNEFDAIMSIAVLHHLPFNLCERAYCEFSRVLSTDGEVLISCWDPSAPSVVKGERDEEQKNVVWVSWTLPDSSSVSRYYHVPKIDVRIKHWKEIHGLVCNHFELRNYNQLFYFSKSKSSR